MVFAACHACSGFRFKGLSFKVQRLSHCAIFRVICRVCMLCWLLKATPKTKPHKVLPVNSALEPHSKKKKNKQKKKQLRLLIIVSAHTSLAARDFSIFLGSSLVSFL